jgi:hypothetical protein
VVEEAFQAAADEAWQPGVASAFSRTLLALVKDDGDAAVAALERFVMNGRADPDLVAEALRWLGHLEHEPTHDARLRLLLGCLKSPSSQVRDAAGLGLALLDDPAALPALREAVEHEASPDLRHDLQQAVEQLEKAA